MHATVLYAIRELHGAAGLLRWLNLTWYAGVCAVSILASWLLYKFVEHPLERKLRGSPMKNHYSSGVVCASV